MKINSVNSHTFSGSVRFVNMPEEIVSKLGVVRDIALSHDIDFTISKINDRNALTFNDLYTFNSSKKIKGYKLTAHGESYFYAPLEATNEEIIPKICDYVMKSIRNLFRSYGDIIQIINIMENSKETESAVRLKFKQ